MGARSAARMRAARYKRMAVGDAYMARYELGQAGPWSATDATRVPGIEWLRILTDHFLAIRYGQPRAVVALGRAPRSRRGLAFEMFPGPPRV